MFGRFEFSTFFLFFPKLKSILYLITLVFEQFFPFLFSFRVDKTLRLHF